MDPVTIIASAIALGAASGLKPTVEQAIKDAYEGLKRLIIDRYSNKGDVIDTMDYLAKKPDASKRRETLEEALTEAGDAQDTALLEAAKTVHTAVKEHDPELPQSIGMDIGALKAAVLEVENVLAGKGGTAVKIGTAEIAGTASFKNIGGGNSNPKT